MCIRDRVHSTEAEGLAHVEGLHLALGHGLVLVFETLWRSEPGNSVFRQMGSQFAHLPKLDAAVTESIPGVCDRRVRHSGCPRPNRECGGALRFSAIGNRYHASLDAVSYTHLTL